MISLRTESTKGQTKAQIGWYLPIALGVPEHWTIMVLRAFLDGSGTSPSSRVLTLAGLAAYAEYWDRFEQRWQTIVDRNGGRAIHASELMQESDRGAEVVAQCVEFLSDLGEQFHLFSCSVSLEAYDLVDKQRGLRALKLPKEICVDWCCGGLFNNLVIDEEQPGSEKIKITFDRGERFRHSIYRVWTASPSKRPAWVKHVTAIEAVESPDVCLPVQAADVVAWVSNRHYTRHDRDEWFDRIWSFEARKKEQTYYDRDSLERLAVKLQTRTRREDA